MAITTNQGLVLPDGTDNANVPLSFTDLISGSGASSLENRLVQRYLSIADRTARNAAPNEGELSYLSDLDRYESYTGSAWVALYPQTAFSVADAAFATSSAAYTTVGGALLGQTIVVPLTGQVEVSWAASMDASVAGAHFISPQLNTGAVIGAGALIVAAADNIAISTTGNDSVTMSNTYVYTGLTPGSSVNAFLLHKSSGTVSIANRKIKVSQA